MHIAYNLSSNQMLGFNPYLALGTARRLEVNRGRGVEV